MHPTLAAITLGSSAFASLVGYLLLIAAAAYAGGSSIAFLSLGHRRMQVLLSLTGGIMLGVGLLSIRSTARANQDWPSSLWSARTRAR